MPENEGYLNEEVQTSTAYVKCDGCGGNMVFDPQTQSLKCEHCGKVEDFAKDSNVQELAIEEGLEKSVKWNDETITYRCENCGAVFAIGADEVAVICPYCSTSHIVKEENLAGIKPNAVYPFLITPEAAVEKSRKWARKRIFAPSAFKKNLLESNLHGTYLPCFTFDSVTVSVYDGRLGKRKTRTVRTSNGKTRTETYIDWRHVSGTFHKSFDDISIACGKLDQTQLNKLLPYKQETLCVYEKKFLSGYVAEHYSRDVKECWGDAKSVIDGNLRTSILHHHNCDVIGYLNVKTNHHNVTYKYLLLPVYRLNYRYNKKDYPVLINGNSGKVTGKSPKSPLRIIIAVVLALGVLLGLAYGYSSCEGEYYESGGGYAVEQVE